MPITPRVVRDPATATANWTKGVQQSGAKWADGYAHPSRNPFDPSVIDPEAWQAGVSNPNAMAAYERNLASVNQDQVLATVNGVGQQKYTASGTQKTSKVSKFQQVFLPKLSQIVSNLNSSMPKGPRGSAQNISRLTTYLQQVAATRGTNF